MKKMEKPIEKITRQIRGQMVLADSTQEIGESQLLDFYALGYLFGFSCGVFNHFEITQYREKVYLLSQVYSKLFGNYGRLLFQESLDLQKNERFLAGANNGWEEMKRWLGRDESPVGLTRFLQEGEPTLSLADWFPKLNKVSELAYA